MDRELRTTLAIMAAVLLLGAPLIFAAPNPADTNYLALVMHIAPPPTPANAPSTNTPTRTPMPIGTPTKTPPAPTNTPVVGVTITPTPGPPPTRTPTAYCAAEYPDFCIPPTAAVKMAAPETYVILISANDSSELVQQARDQQVDIFIPKQNFLGRLGEVVRSVLLPVAASH